LVQRAKFITVVDTISTTVIFYFPPSKEYLDHLILYE